MRKTYLGDAVYAEIDSAGYLVLTTENGIETTNTIYLEPEVYAALKMYEEVIRNETRKETKTDSGRAGEEPSAGEDAGEGTSTGTSKAT